MFQEFKEFQGFQKLKTLPFEETPIVENYMEGRTSEKELLQVKSYYYKKIPAAHFGQNLSNA